MDIIQIHTLAHNLMAQHGLIAKGWRFEFDNARKRGGQCRHTHRAISVSRYLAPSWSEEEVRNTLLHEIAHALVGPGQGHNAVWRAKAMSIGCTGDRTHDNATVPGRYVAHCDYCGIEVGRRHRLTAAMRRGGLHAKCRKPVRWVDTGVAHRVS